MTAISKAPTTAEFKRDPELYMEQVNTDTEPLILTSDNKPDVVLLTLEAYQALLARIEHWESVAAIRQSQLQFARGEGRDAREAFEEQRQKLGIPR